MTTYSTDTRYCTQTIEPPCTERYARWCERSAAQLMGSLLLDLRELDLDNIILNIEIVVLVVRIVARV